MTQTVPAADSGRPLDLFTPSTVPNGLISAMSYLHLRHLGGWLPTGVWASLLGELGVGDGAARSALRRMVRGGFLEPAAQQGRRGQRMTARWLQYLDAMDGLGVGPEAGPPALSDGWLLVAYSIPEGRRDERNRLRRLLRRLGLGNLDGGLWIGVARDERYVADWLRWSGQESAAHLFRADHRGFAGVRETAARLWELDRLAHDYRAYLRELDSSPARNAQEAFQRLTLAFFRLRRVSAGDPGLPLEVLPPGWAGWEAWNRFHQLRESLGPHASAHVRGTL